MSTVSMRTTLLLAVVGAGALYLSRPGMVVRLAAQGGPPSSVTTPELPGEWMYPRASRDVLAAVRTTLHASGLALQHEDRDVGALVTKAVPYDLARWPEASALDLPLGHTPETLQFHIHVSPDLEPARIAVGAVLDTTTTQTPMRGSRARGSGRFYGQRRLAARFVEHLSAQLGVPPEPLAATGTLRVAQARRLLPAGLDGGCGVREIPSLGGPGGRLPERLPRRARYAALPVYPEEQQARGAGGEIQIAGEITEHGTLIDLTTESDAIGDGNLKAAAFGAAGLWRYRPAVLDGCPTRVRLTLSIQFSMVRP